MCITTDSKDTLEPINGYFFKHVVVIEYFFCVKKNRVKKKEYISVPIL